ncbi:MAG TPA: IPT/TIG domain-containing protein [Solirubrobacteraceae bacterium]|nr:IPT/TIG domain-containing protein [Solirubrobacteraceae bacterium]
MRFARAGAARHALIAALLTALALLLTFALLALTGADGGAVGASSSVPGTATRDGLRLDAPRAFGRVGAASTLPLALQAELASARAASEQKFAARRDAGDRDGFQTANAAQGLAGSYDARGIELSEAGLTERLGLISLSAGARATTTLGAATLTAHANRVTLSRAQLSEWYSNSSLGIEQGFTIARAPSAASSAAASTELALGIALSGNATPRLSSDGGTLTLDHGSTAISYGALRATDATGRVLHSSLSLQGSTLTLHVETAGARYPLSVDPLIQKGGKLAGTEAESRFGTSMALSADGSTLIVGAPQASGSTGAAYVYTREGESWVKQAAITPPAPTTSLQSEEQCAEESPEEAGECAFGASVAISADGKTALIGDPSPSTTAGSALIYVRSEAGEWSQQAMLSGDGLASSHEGRFGKSVALSADGSTALVGVPSGGNLRGGAWVFARTGTEWSKQAALIDSEAVPLARFGRAVALSADGQTALIGGPTATGSVGAAWTFARSGAVWTQQGAALLGGEAELGAGHFGKSVALSGDGQTALVGAPEANGARGTVWAYGRSGSTFAEQGGALDEGAEAEEGTRFGTSVALSGDGALALIGAPHRTGGFGSVTQWAHAGTEWTLRPQRLGGSEGSGKGYTGASAAFSSDGLVAAIGGPRDAKRMGAAWVFSFEHETPPPTLESVAPGHGPTEGGTEVTISGKNLIGEGGELPTVLFGSTPATSVEERSVAEIVVRSPANAAGIVDVTVKTSSGTSALSTADHFSYEAQGSNEKPTDKELKGKKAPNEDPSQVSSGGTPQAAGGVLGTASAADAACRLSLRKSRLAVTHNKVVALRLQRTGAGACAGKLTLSFNKSKRGKRAKLTTVGTAAFSISSGVSKVFTITLNKVGRILFHNHGGRLNLSLSIARSTPAPKLARSASVRLTRKKVAKKVTLVR